jgi:hypothetical protein
MMHGDPECNVLTLLDHLALPVANYHLERLTSWLEAHLLIFELSYALLKSTTRDNGWCLNCSAISTLS